MSGDKSTRMTDGPIWRHLVLFSLPLVAGNLFQQMYNTVDTLVIGNYLGPSALASVGAGAVIIGLMVSLFSGLGTGSGVVIAQLFGAGDDDGVRRAVATTAAFTLISGVVMTAVWVWASGPILRLLGTPDELLDEATIYLQIFFSGIVPGLIFNMGSGILRAVGDSRTPLIHLAIAAVINTVLDILFVAWLGMRAEGVAIATLIAQIAAAALVIRRLVSARGAYRVSPLGMRVHGPALARILKVGVPAGVQSMLMGISNVVVQSYINALGTSVIAAWNVFGKIDAIVFLPLLSFGLAMMTYAGQNYGAGRIDRVRAGVRIGLALSVGTCLVFSLAIWLWSMPLMRLFTDDTAILDTGRVIMTWMCPFYGLCAAMYIFSGAINGVGASLAAMLIMLSNLCVLRIGMLWAIAPHWPGIELMLAVYPVSWGLCTLGLIVYYKIGSWQKRPIYGGE